MIRKRSLLSDICDVKRKKLNSFQENGSLKDIPTDTSPALQYLSSIFPLEKFQNRLPPIVMRHQIYAFVKCRTEVDKQLSDMCKQGEIRLFKLGNSEDEIAIVYMKDYKQHIERCCQNNTVVGNFMNTVVTVCPDICFAKNILMSNYGIKEGN
ncbi:Serine/threonine-protein kinase 19, partial [Stegodyphus mimosarum]